MGWSAYDSSGAKIERALSDLPVGTVVGTARTSTPYGWLLCDGSAVSRSTYPELFGAIGTAYGSGNGTTTFNVPNSDGDMILAVSTAEKFGINDGSAIANASVTSAKLAQGATSVTYVTSLPSSPVDGQEVYFQADGTNGIIWHLRYRLNSSSPYKWEFVGGQELVSSSSVAWITNNTSYSTSANINGGSFPTISVPVAGDYDVTIFVNNAFTNAGAGYNGSISYTVGAAAAQDADGIGFTSPGNSYAVGPLQYTSRKTSIAASTTISMAAKIDNSGANLYIGANAAKPAGLRIQPVRIG